MTYSDGHESKAGDEVQIDVNHRGIVIACIDTGDYLPGEESWAYLEEGIMVDTDFGGLVHYTDDAADELTLLRRLQA